MEPTCPPPTERTYLYRWCPWCVVWVYGHGLRRCRECRTALIRRVRPIKAKRGELRPGVVAEWED